MAEPASDNASNSSKSTYQFDKQLEKSLDSEAQSEEDGHLQIVETLPSSNESSQEPLYSLCPDVRDLPLRPPPAIEANYVQYYIIDFTKPGHDQYIYRHANGLCVIGLASTHVALGDNPQVKAVDFQVGKSNRSDIKVTGKRKRNAHHLEANSALCKVISNDTFYIIRCCVKGSLLEVNERLIKEPELLNRAASREGYVAIMMPRPEDWLKSMKSLLTREEYKRQRGLC